jgi:hypothetical protein
MTDRLAPGAADASPPITWRDLAETVEPTVLVLGGFMSSPPMYRGLRGLLLERGAAEVVVAPIWLPDWILSVARGQGAVATRAGRALLRASAASTESPLSRGAPVLVIGHSAGGVLARVLTSPVPFEGRPMNGSSRIGAIVTLGTPHMFDADAGGARKPGETSRWANEHVPGPCFAPRVGYLCVSSRSVIGSSDGDAKARRTDRFYRGVVSAPGGEPIPGDGVVPLAAALLPGVESIVLDDAGHSNLIARTWYGDTGHVDAWWPRAVEIWRDALRARMAVAETAEIAASPATA